MERPRRSGARGGCSETLVSGSTRGAEASSQGPRWVQKCRSPLPCQRLLPTASATRALTPVGPAKVAVFVDGCFWHRCPDHGSLPATNADYWIPKLDRNVERDHEITILLKEPGWRVIRVWEHQSPDAPARRIAQAVSGRPNHVH